MSRCLFLIILFCGLSLSMLADNDEEQYRGIYNQAEFDYNIGKIESSEMLLKEHLNSFPPSLLPSVYRMLSLCYLAMDRTDDAQTYVGLLLNENPYYSTTLNDPERFKDMVENTKSGRTATITTASSQAEDISEVPVPMTLITEEMIRNSGARNLQEVLAAYVPSMTIVDCNDDINIAMRGIYSNGQEKILIMLNGHRLNSYCTNIASPDFSINLDKLKQIEVLRGPASSLYGGVSLTAVVNLITKQGVDVDGVQVRAGGGNYGQVRGSMIFGKRYFELDLLVWGGIYSAKGERVNVPFEDTGMRLLSDGDVVVGGIGNKPSYDVGMSLKYKNLQFLYNTQFSQIRSPMTMTYLFSPYQIEKYRTMNGIRPSFATLSHHANLSYTHRLRNLSLKGSVSYDNSDLTHYQVITDPSLDALIELLPLPPSLSELLKGTGGISRYINGQEQTFGGKLQADWTYINNGMHKGLFSVGSEFSYFQLNDVRYAFGYDYTSLAPENEAISTLGKGHETNLNGFVQLKHHWRSFILNAGLRFDYKNRYNDTKIREFSPRLALIFVQPKWNLKLSYSKAFIDAPYLYRKTNLFLADYVSMSDLSEDLNPESLHSFQLTFGAKNWVKGLEFELNAFYNRARDLIFLQMYEHFNAGDVDTYGLEMTGSYKHRRFSANLSFSFQKTSKMLIFNREIGHATNTPQLSSNIVLAWHATKNLCLHTHISFDSKQYAYFSDVLKYGTYLGQMNELERLMEQYANDPTSVADEEIDRVLASALETGKQINVTRDVKARVLFNIGANYSIGRHLELALNVKNLLNTNYVQSGMSTGLIPQRGRWFMAEVAYKF